MNNSFLFLPVLFLNDLNCPNVITFVFTTKFELNLIFVVIFTQPFVIILIIINRIVNKLLICTPLVTHIIGINKQIGLHYLTKEWPKWPKESYLMAVPKLRIVQIVNRKLNVSPQPAFLDTFTSTVNETQTYETYCRIHWIYRSSCVCVYAISHFRLDYVAHTSIA